MNDLIAGYLDDVMDSFADNNWCMETLKTLFRLRMKTDSDIKWRSGADSLRELVRMTHVVNKGGLGEQGTLVVRLEHASLFLATRPELDSSEKSLNSVIGSRTLP